MLIFIIIYIPLCLYFNCYGIQTEQQGIYIYIPLCLYFNVLVRTSVLYGIFIYIPLCLYFNVQGKIIFCRCKRIYIPLCLYFNWRAVRCPNVTYSFTFHYVSILICSDIGWLSVNLIYIPLCLYFNIFCSFFIYYINNYLHSIMSLF